MYRFTLLFLFILSTSIFSQNITNTLGASGAFYVKNSSSTSLLTVNDGNTNVEGTLTVSNNGGGAYTLPSGRGTSGQYLQTNGAGSLNWATVNVPATVSLRYLICVSGLFPSGDVTEHFLGEIILFAGSASYIPTNFMECKGQSLPVASYTALYAVIGNTYGGNSTNFNLPNLTSKAAVGQ